MTPNNLLTTPSNTLQKPSKHTPKELRVLKGWKRCEILVAFSLLQEQVITPPWCRLMTKTQFFDQNDTAIKPF